MDAILILVIISIQFTLIHFGVKRLSVLNNKLVSLNEEIELITPKIKSGFEKTRKLIACVNNILNKYIENQDKIKVIKIIFLIYSFMTAIIIFKKRKNPFNLYSLYDVVVKMTRTILGL